MPQPYSPISEPQYYYDEQGNLVEAYYDAQGNVVQWSYVPQATPYNPAPAMPQQPAEEEKKKKKKGGCLWRLIFWLALLIFLVSVGVLGYLFWTYWNGQNEYDQIAERALANEIEGANLGDMVVDWDALRAINPEVVAWVYIPDTIVNYPVAHKPGDSKYYLKHNFSNDEGSFGAEYGSIMLSGENQGDFSDEVNIIYGHHMRNGSMFAPLGDFFDSEIFNQNRTIYLLTPEGNYRLETFAVEHVPMTHGSIATPNYATDAEFTEFKQWLIDNSVVTPDPNTDAEALAATKLFGFCTCDGDDNTWRYITFATVAEFVPADKVGTGDYQSATTVDQSDINNVQSDAQDRAEDLGIEVQEGAQPQDAAAEEPAAQEPTTQEPTAG